MNSLEVAFALLRMPELTSAGVAFLASFLLCIAVVLTKSYHGAFSMDHTDGIQKFHFAPTPRIGGIPIVLAFLCIGNLAKVCALIDAITNVDGHLEVIGANYQTQQ